MLVCHYLVQKAFIERITILQKLCDISLTLVVVVHRVDQHLHLRHGGTDLVLRVTLDGSSVEAVELQTLIAMLLHV